VLGGGCNVFVKLKNPIFLNDISKIGSGLNRDLMNIDTTNHE
jgi:hypothetical protein